MTTIQFVEHVSYETLKNTLKKLPAVTTTLLVKPNTPTEALYEAVQLLTFVSEKRSNDKKSWSTIGRLLYKLSNETINGLDAWIVFSKRGTIFNEEDCCNYWTTIHKPTESIHVLFSYIHQDKVNMESYLIYKNTNGKLKLLKSISSGLYEEDVAGVMYILYKDEFLYYNGSWYKYKDQYWFPIRDSIELRGRIPKLYEFFTEILKSNRTELTEADNKVKDMEDNMDDEQDENDDEEVQKMKEVKKKKILEELQKEVTRIHGIREQILLIRKQLKKISFKNGIMTECKDIFFDTCGILDTCNIKESKLIVHDSVQNEETIISDLQNNKIQLYQIKKSSYSCNEKIYTNNIRNKLKQPTNYITSVITEQLKDKWIASNTYKRVNEIIFDFKLKKENIISQKIKEYFIKNGVKVEEDKSNGHKIYIKYI
jgi:hypothetical protein